MNFSSTAMKITMKHYTENPNYGHNGYTLFSPLPSAGLSPNSIQTKNSPKSRLAYTLS